jgi:D-sedoheptulose 7-phosphate isomerase
VNTTRTAVRVVAGTTGTLTMHLEDHVETLRELGMAIPTLVEWGHELHARLRTGHRLIAAGNGGSAAEAQHLTAELVGRFDGERNPFSAIALHADTSSITAIGNDYGFEEVFARQVGAHARAGDVVMLLSTSGRSPNLVRAARAAHRCGALAWALTGPAPNPLALECDSAIALGGTGAAVQEAHLVAVHMLCRVFDAHARHDGVPE